MATRGKVKEAGWKRKKWVKIAAPSLFNEKIIGETPCFVSDDVLDRTVKVNMMNLTGNIKKQNTNVMIVVDRVTGDVAHTHIVKYEVLPAYVKKIVRRGKDRLDESYLCTTSDGKNIRIKTLMLTRRIAKGLQLKNAGILLKKSVMEACSKTKFIDFIRDIISNKVQRECKEKVNKIYPMKLVEIRVVELLKDTKAAAAIKVETPKDVETKVESVKETKIESPKEELPKEAKVEAPKESEVQAVPAKA